MDGDAKAEAEAVAMRRVRLRCLLVTEIGRENNIQVNERYRKAKIEEARRYPMSGANGAGVFSEEPAGNAANRWPNI